MKVAVIGTGNMGQHHVRIYSEMPDVDLVAICDKDEKRGKELANEHNCLFYNDYKKMLKEHRIDAVSIAVPTFLHHQVACEVLKMGTHVLLEKPIATTLQEAKDIIKKTKENNKKLMIGHIERFNPAVQRLRELIIKGRLGDIISISIKRVGGLPPQIKNANVMIDLAIHDIDISNYLLNQFPREIYGIKSKTLSNKQEDNAIVVLKYEKASSVIEVNWITPVKIRTLDITGTKAFARLDYINQTINLYENSFLDKKSKKYSDFNEFIAKFSTADEVRVGITKTEPLRYELESFIACIRNNTEPPVNGEAGYKALEVALKV